MTFFKRCELEFYHKYRQNCVKGAAGKYINHVLFFFRSLNLLIYYLPTIKSSYRLKGSRVSALHAAKTQNNLSEEFGVF